VAERRFRASNKDVMLVGGLRISSNMMKGLLGSEDTCELIGQN
jgi:hypothetical protein